MLNLKEKDRLILQTELDSKKSRAERNRLGQFATPASLASEILKTSCRLLGRGSKIRFLDPGFGTGSFFSALLSTFNSARIEWAAGYEIDPEVVNKTRPLWNQTNLRLMLEDFTRVAPHPEELANLLVCNPPYVRHHHLKPEEKLRLNRAVFKITGTNLSGLSGLYCYYILLSHQWMSEGGLAAWLIPSEFMDVNYGKELKNYLLSSVTLLRIHRFDPQEVQFDEALVSSSVLWFKKSLPSRNHKIQFTLGGSVLVPKITSEVSIEDLRRSFKWSLACHSSNGKADRAKHEVALGDLFTIKRGIATGSNHYFILEDKEIKQKGIPPRFFQPILPSPRALETDEVKAAPDGTPNLPTKLFLLKCDLLEQRLSKESENLWNYIREGIEQGINTRYLCRHRSPWYSQENRNPTPYLCTYMGRERQMRKNPFRFILNHSNAVAANVYLMLYPKPFLAEMINKTPGLLERIWFVLKEINPVELLRVGRTYGGGLHKLEPHELANAPGQKIMDVLPVKVTSLPKQLKFDDIIT